MLQSQDSRGGSWSPPHTWRALSDVTLARVKKTENLKPEIESKNVRENEILKEEIESLKFTIKSKNNELLLKDREINDLKAKLLCEENLNKEKLRKEKQINAEMSQKVDFLQKELSRMNLGRKEPVIKHKNQSKIPELFPNATKDDLISETDLRPKNN